MRNNEKILLFFFTKVWALSACWICIVGHTPDVPSPCGFMGRNGFWNSANTYSLHAVLPNCFGIGQYSEDHNALAGLYYITVLHKVVSKMQMSLKERISTVSFWFCLKLSLPGLNRIIEKNFCFNFLD